MAFILLLRLGGDVVAGITVASMLIPQSVSYATSLAKLNPITGLVRLPQPASYVVHNTFTDMPRLF
jgi:MFS superfamily sulfate permease-like transporter